MRKGQATPEQRARNSESHKGLRHSPETRAKLSAALMGHHVDAATRAKIGAAQRGRPGHPQTLEARAKVGAARRNIKGDDVGYRAAHLRASKVLPKACARCGATEGLLDAALRYDAPDEHLSRTRGGLSYSPAHPEDYVRLCRSCHRAYDRA